MKEPALGLVPDLTGTKPLVDIVGLPRALETLPDRPHRRGRGGGRAAAWPSWSCPGRSWTRAVGDLVGGAARRRARGGAGRPRSCSSRPRPYPDEQAAAERARRPRSSAPLGAGSCPSCSPARRARRAVLAERRARSGERVARSRPRARTAFGAERRAEGPEVVPPDWHRSPSADREMRRGGCRLMNGPAGRPCARSTGTRRSLSSGSSRARSAGSCPTPGPTAATSSSFLAMIALAAVATVARAAAAEDHHRPGHPGAERRRGHRGGRGRRRAWRWSAPLLSFAQRWYSARIGEGLIYDLRTEVFEHVQRQPIAFFTRAQTGVAGQPAEQRRHRRAAGRSPRPCPAVVSNVLTLVLVADRHVQPVLADHGDHAGDASRRS